MDRRVLVKSLLGVAGASALAIALPPQAEALMGLPPKVPAPGSSVLPDLDHLDDATEEGEEPVLGEGVELVSNKHHHHHYRRRRRGWRWRRYCRREYWHGRYRRRCRRRRVMFWISI